VSYLYYADRLVQFPLGIFAIATATAVLPSLSRQAAEKNLPAVRDTFSYAMRLVFFITIPSMIGLIVLREPIVALLFKRGLFDVEATRLTAYALLYYAVGLWAFSAVRIVVSTFYSLQDTRTPVRAAAISVCANILLGIILMGPLKHGGLALSTSLASMINLVLLVQALKVKLGGLGLRNISRSAGKTVVCSAAMGIVVWAVAQLIIPSENGTISRLCFGIVGSIFSGMVCYGGFSLLLKSQELNHVLEMTKRGMGK
jgi:putative peptidoglycan lipid II flippase